MSIGTGSFRDDDPRVLLLVDPQWTPTAEESAAPLERIVGGWWLGGDGSGGRFAANPDYVPLEPGSPTDPIDAVLQLLVRGDAEGDELLAVLDAVALGVALDADGAALVTPAPDGEPAVAVATSVHHRARLPAASWREVTLAELARALPERGVDVLLNPGAPASMRVLADAVRAVAGIGARAA